MWYSINVVESLLPPMSLPFSSLPRIYSFAWKAKLMRFSFATWIYITSSGFPSVFRVGPQSGFSLFFFLALFYFADAPSFTLPLPSPICNSDSLLPHNRAFKWIRLANNFCEVAFSNGVITQWCTNVVFALLVGKQRSGSEWQPAVRSSVRPSVCLYRRAKDLCCTLFWFGGNRSHFDCETVKYLWVDCTA